MEVFGNRTWRDVTIGNHDADVIVEGLNLGKSCYKAGNCQYTELEDRLSIIQPWPLSFEIPSMAGEM